MLPGPHHDRPVAQCVRRDRREHPHVEIGLDDGTAAGQRVSGRAGCGGDHDAVAAMGVDKAPVDRGLEVERAAGVHFGEHDVVQGECAHRRGAVVLEPRREERAPILGEASREHRFDVLEHRGRPHIGEETEAPAVDAEQRHRPAGDQARRIEKRAVSADRHDEIGAGGERAFRAGHDGIGRELEADARIDERPPAARLEMADQAEHALGDTQILGIADEGDRLEGGHGGLCSMFDATLHSSKSRQFDRFCADLTPRGALGSFKRAIWSVCQKVPRRH